MVANTLLDTAIDQFGRLGFEGASTREIARASNTAMSSITYHFGGKEGLYLAAADHIASSVAQMQAPAIAAALEAAKGSEAEATEALLGLIDSMAQMMLGPKTESWSRLIIREQLAPTEAFEHFYRGAIRPVADAFVPLLRRLRPDVGAAEAQALALTIFGQVLVLRAARATVCRVMEIEQIDEASAALLRARIRANILCILSEKP
jgi:AcrR family transcriptional regulator